MGSELVPPNKALQTRAYTSHHGRGVGGRARDPNRSARVDRFSI
jgi:hypothetical protein